MRSKKGFDKAIEIFIFLFIIIVVSIVVLRMFKSEIADKQADLGELKRSELQTQSIRKAKTECHTLCAEAERDGCSEQSITAFCNYNVGPLDLDGDLGYSSSDTNLLGGLGVCEDKIVCPLLVDCTCSEELTLQACANHIKAYQNQLPGNPALCSDFIDKGDCNLTGVPAWNDGLSCS
ncbi:MAG: hypothetical protein ACQESG_01055 [Nanobdellota archaeon]